VGATALYAVFGTAPLWLDSLAAILAGRIALGVMEAVLMTVSTTLIGDYYTGARRETFVSLQAQVGTAYAFNSAAKITGTLLFGWVVAPCLRVPWQIALSVAVAGTGLVLMKFAGDYNSLVAGGLLLPTMVTWAMRGLPFSRRGFGMGAFHSSMFLGMFVNPILIVSLSKALGDSGAAELGAFGMLLLVLAVVAAVVGLRTWRA
jgi:hypothetical protein